MLPGRTLDVTLDLKDPQYPEENLGSLELAVTLSPKEGDVRDAVRNLTELLSESHCSIISSFLLHTITTFPLIQGDHCILFYLPLIIYDISCQNKE